MRTGVFNFLAQDRVHFGVSAAEGIAAEVAERGAQRLFVVTSRSLNRNTAAVTDALATVKDQVVGLFDECVEHTPRDTVIALTRRLRDSRADLIVSIGGGTVIDTVKVALVCLAEGVDDVDAMGAWHMRVNPDGTRFTPQPRLPPCRQIAVPTTLSGAEFSDLGGCTDTRHGAKQGYTGSHIGAAAVILDPRITVHTPQRLWLSTGVRALDHAVESLCSINAQPLVDATSVRALALLGRALTRYATDPQDLDARLDAQLGAWLAAMGIRRTDYGASHGLGHALGADAGVPHGITSCVLLPAVMRYNAEACAPQLAEVALALGDSKQPAADQIEGLISRLGLPTRISQLGIDRSRLPILADKGMAIPWVRTNPRKIDRVAQLVEILESAW
jgi:alcohol dehydrogenase class IV